MSGIVTDRSQPADNSGGQTALFGSPKDRLDFYRKEIQYETAILSNRTNAYLGAQSFLVIAYTSCMANVNPQWGHAFTLVVPALLTLLGVITSLHAWPGLRAAYEIIDHWYFKQAQLLKSEPGLDNVYDDSPLFAQRESEEKGYRKALRFSMRSPWIFCAFWVLLGVIAVGVHL